MNSAYAGQLKSSGDETAAADQIRNKSIVVPNRVVALANSFEKKDRSWYVKFLLYITYCRIKNQ